MHLIKLSAKTEKNGHLIIAYIFYFNSVFPLLVPPLHSWSCSLALLPGTSNTSQPSWGLLSPSINRFDDTDSVCFISLNCSHSTERAPRHLHTDSSRLLLYYCSEYRRPMERLHRTGDKKVNEIENAMKVQILDLGDVLLIGAAIESGNRQNPPPPTPPPCRVYPLRDWCAGHSQLCREISCRLWDGDERPNAACDKSDVTNDPFSLITDDFH